MCKIIDAKTIAARCKSAGADGIFKSYIRNIRIADRRRENDWFMFEYDFSFTHKGDRYIIRQEIIGDKRYSAAFQYKLEKVS